MADKQISQLTAGTIDNNADSFMFDDADGYTYKLPYSDLAGAVLGQSLGAGTGIDITTDSQSAIYKKIISVDADSTPTQNSQKPVTSGGVYSALDNKQDELTFDNSPTPNSGNPVTSAGIYVALDAKQDELTFDNMPTQNSGNPVTSNGIYTALAGKQDSLTFDPTPLQNSTNPVTSGGVYAAIQGGGGGGITKTLLFDNHCDQFQITTISADTHLITGGYDEIEIEAVFFDNRSSGGSSNLCYPIHIVVRPDTLSTLMTDYTGIYNVGIVVEGYDNTYAYYEVSETLDVDDNPITQFTYYAVSSNVPADMALNINRIWGVTY